MKQSTVQPEYANTTRVLQGQSLPAHAPDSALQILEASDDISFLLSPRGRVIFANTSACGLLTDSEQTITGEALFNLLEPGLWGEVMARLPQVLNGIHQQEFDCQHTQNGKTVCYRTSMSLITYNNSPSVLLVMKDDTGRLKSEELYKTLYDKMMEGFAIHEIICNDAGKPIDYRFLSVNPAFESVTGLPACAVVGRRILEVLPETEPYWIERYGMVALTGEPLHFCQFSRELNKHFSVSAYRTAPMQFACFFSDITESKRNEELLLRKSNEWERTFNAVPETITILDTQHRILNINRAGCQMLQLTHDEILGRRCYEIFHHKSCPPENCPHTALMRDGLPHNLQMHEDYLQRDLDIHAIPLHDADNRLTGSVHVVWDVTEKKLAENALRVSEQKYRMLFENMNAGFLLHEMIFDPQGKMIDCIGVEANPAFETLTGIKLADFLGKSLRQTLPFLDQQWFDVAEKVVRSGEPTAVEYYFETLDRFANFWFFRADVGHFAVIFTDVTDRKRAEEQLRLKETAIESSFNGIAISDLSGRILYSNKAFLDIWGYSKQLDVTGKHALSFAQDDLIAEAVRRTTTEGIWRGEEMKSRSLSGHEVFTNVSMSLVHSASGVASCLMCVIMDVTERKRLALEAEHRREQLNHADKLVTIGTMVACIMHEINNPVGVITLNIPVLESILQSLLPLLDQAAQSQPDLRVNNAPYEKVRAYIPQLIDGVTDAAGRITRIIKRLKDFSRPDAAEVRSSMNINDVVKNAAGFLESHIRKHTHRFSLELGAELPIIPSAYPHRIEQVVINIIMNACQALMSPNEAIRVKTGQDGNGLLVIEVSDQGCGIAEEDLNKINTPFFTTKHDRGGSGLGLSICNSILADHGGFLKFFSEKGNGTSVRILLPQCGIK